MKKIFPLILLISLAIPAISFSEGYSDKPAVYTGTIFATKDSPAKLEPAAGEVKPVKMQPVYSGRYKPRKPVAATSAAAKAAPAVSKPVYTRPAGRVAKTIFSTTTEGQRVLVTFNNRPKMKTAKSTDGTITFFFEAPVTYTAPAIPKAFQKNFLKVAGSTAPNGNLIITIQHDPARTSNVSFASSMILVDVLKPKKPEEIKPKEEEKKPEEVKKEEVKAASAVSAQYSQEGEVEKLRFEFSKPTPAAVFSRFGYYWLVFDSTENQEIPEEIKMSDIFQASEKITVENAQVFSLIQVKDAHASVIKDKNAWVIEFDPKNDPKIDRPMTLEDSADFYKIAAPGKGRRIDIVDKHVGDNLIVIPFSESGFGVNKEEVKTNFALEKSNLGVVIKQILPPLMVNLDDAMIVRIPKDGKDLPAAETPADPKKPEAATEAKPEEVKPAPPIAQKDLKPLYKFEKWQQLTSAQFDEAARKLRADNYEYGKFLFTQGLYAEASNILAGVKGFQAQFLSAASFYMIGRYADAVEGFDRLSLANDMDKNEFLLWKNAANYRLSNIQPQIAQQLDMSGFAIPLTLDTYPDNIKHKLLLDLAESTINAAKSSEAQNYINLLPKTGLLPQQESYRNYLQGKIFALQSKRDRAYQLWSEIATNSSDRESRAKARYEIVMMDLASGKLKPEQVVKILDDLRVVWRGDMFEYNLLYQLGDLSAKSKNEVQTLRIYREMLSNFPRFPKNDEIASKMQDLFNAAMERSLSKKENVFEAITIYYEFEELKPVGEKGDQVTIQLAEALTKFDLLTDAAKLLSKYADSKTVDAEKAEIETRVAVLYFLNNKFKEASEVLQKKYDETQIPTYLIQERQILLSRSLIELGDYNAANAVIAKLPSEMFFRFKTDILWKQRKWADLITAYKYVSDKTEDDIMKLAMAYALTGDDEALSALRTSYLGKMNKTQYAQNFEFITDTENLDYRNLAGTLKLPDTEKLIESYKKKIQTEGIGAVAANPADSKTSAGDKPAEQKPQPEADKAEKKQ